MRYIVESSERGYINQVRWDDDMGGILDVCYTFSKIMRRTFTAKQLRIVKQYCAYYEIDITITETAED